MLRGGAHVIALAPKAVEALFVLAANNGRVVEKDELLKRNLTASKPGQDFDSAPLRQGAWQRRAPPSRGRRQVRATFRMRS